MKKVTISDKRIGKTNAMSLFNFAKSAGVDIKYYTIVNCRDEAGNKCQAYATKSFLENVLLGDEVLRNSQGYLSFIETQTSDKEQIKTKKIARCLELLKENPTHVNANKVYKELTGKTYTSTPSQEELEEELAEVIETLAVAPTAALKAKYKELTGIKYDVNNIVTELKG